MAGDFSRNTFEKKKHFSSVRMQQGRVQLDADWNEQMDILDYHRQIETIDFIGESGTPEGTKGFDINVNQKKDNLTIGQGHYYLNGLLVEIEHNSQGNNPLFTEQTDFPKATLPTANELYLAYLDAWQHSITAADNAALLEPALDGADTTTRLKTLGQVKLLPLQTDKTKISKPNCVNLFDTTSTLTAVKHNITEWNKLIKTSNQGQLSAKVNSAQLGNQLYRVEIHQSGTEDKAKFKWSRDNASVAASISDIKNVTQSSVTITIKSLNNDNHQFKAKQWFEITNNTRMLTGQAGILLPLQTTKDNQLTFIQWPTNISITDFKNGILRRWDTNPISLNDSSLTKIVSPIRDSKTKRITITLDKGATWPLGLAVGQTIELTNESRITNNQRGHLTEIVQIPSKSTNLLIVNDANLLTNTQLKEFTRLRIFKSGLFSINQTNFIALENGLEVKFTKGNYKVGDYWLIPTRAKSNDILNWPQTKEGKPADKLPEGIKHYYAKLALLKKTANGWQKLEDCRHTFMPLTNKAYQAATTVNNSNNGAVSVDANSNVEITKGNLNVNKNLNVTGKTKTGTLQLGTSLTVDTITTTLSANRDSALPTEKAIKEQLSLTPVENKVPQAGESGVIDLKWSFGYAALRKLLGNGWIEVKSMAQTREFTTANTINNKIYLFGGYNNISLDSVEEYDPIANKSINNKTKLSAARYQIASTVVNGKIYLFGGRNKTKVFDLVEAYDPVNNTWQTSDKNKIYDSVKNIWQTDTNQNPLQPMPTARTSATANVVNGRIYVIGGNKFNDLSLNTVEEYDPNTNTWRSSDVTKNPVGVKSLAVFPSKTISDASAGVINNKIYVCGGYTGSNHRIVFEEMKIYDPKTNTWTNAPSMKKARRIATSSVVNGKLYAIGGWIPNNSHWTLKTIEEYDPSTGTWRTLADMPTARYAPASAVVRGEIYVFGGSVIHGITSVVEVYVPTAFN